MALADPDLGNRAPAALLHHLAAARRLEVDADLVDIGDALLLEQPLGRLAKGGGRGKVHSYLRHWLKRLSARPRPSGLFRRQSGLLPAGKPAAQVEGLGVAEL